MIEAILRGMAIFIAISAFFIFYTVIAMVVNLLFETPPLLNFVVEIVITIILAVIFRDK